MLYCSNTTVTLLRTSSTVTAGRMDMAEASAGTGIQAYREHQNTDRVQTEVGIKSVLFSLFVLDTTNVEPSDIIQDDGDGAKKHRITNLQVFDDHSEASAEEIIADD